jgi:hypothetical protein
LRVLPGSLMAVLVQQLETPRSYKQAKATASPMPEIAVTEADPNSP